MTHTLLLIQWPVPPGEGWSAGYNGLDRSVALGRSVNGSLHKQQQLNLGTTVLNLKLNLLLPCGTRAVPKFSFDRITKFSFDSISKWEIHD